MLCRSDQLLQTVQNVDHQNHLKKKETTTLKWTPVTYSIDLWFAHHVSYTPISRCVIFNLTKDTLMNAKKKRRKQHHGTGKKSTHKSLNRRRQWSGINKKQTIFNNVYIDILKCIERANWRRCEEMRNWGEVEMKREKSQSNEISGGFIVASSMFAYFLSLNSSKQCVNIYLRLIYEKMRNKRAKNSRK